MEQETMKTRKPFKRHCRRCNKIFAPYGRTNKLCEKCIEKAKRMSNGKQKGTYTAFDVQAYFKAQWEKKQKRKGLNTSSSSTSHD